VTGTVRVIDRAAAAQLLTDDDALLRLCQYIEEAMVSVDELRPRAEVVFGGVSTELGQQHLYLTGLCPGSTTLRLFPGPGTKSDHALCVRLDGAGRLRLIAALDELNTLRTSAPIAIGVRHLAKPDARSVAMLGSGRQARSQAQLIHLLRPQLNQFRVWSPTMEHRQRFAADVEKWPGVSCAVAESADEAVKSADVVVFAGTPAPAGSLTFEWADVAPAAVFTDIAFAVPPQLWAEARLVVPCAVRAIPTAFGFPNRWGPPFEVGVDPLAALEPSVLTDVIRGAAPWHQSSGPVIFELGGTYSWDDAFARWIEESASEHELGHELDWL
jgi:alanine dehydrogenase